MIEPSENKSGIVRARLTVQVDAEVKTWLKQEVHRRWRETGKEPTENDLLRELIETYQKKIAISSPQLHNIKLSDSLGKLLGMLIAFYARASVSSDEHMQRGLVAITHNLEWFYGSIGDPERVEPIQIEIRFDKDIPGNPAPEKPRTKHR